MNRCHRVAALLALVLGIGALTIVSCKSSTDTAEVKATETVTLDLTGMT